MARAADPSTSVGIERLAHASSPPLEKVGRNEIRRICGALDVLVRTTRSDPVNAQRLAPRACDGLRTLSSALVIVPRAILCEGVPVFEASGVEGAWCLAAYMAGLRSFQCRSELTADEVLDFATRLGVVRVEASKLDDFRDYLWAGASAGIEVQIAPSFVEVAMTMEVVGKTQSGVGAVRAFAAFSEEGVSIRSPDIDAAALDSEFDVPIDPLRKAWASRSIEPSEIDLAAARSTVLDLRSWAKVELTLAIEVAEVRASFPPIRATRRLLTWFEGPLDLSKMEVLRGLFASSDPYIASVVAGASGRPLGLALADGLALGDSLADATVFALLAGLDGVTREAVAWGLLRHAHHDPRARTFLESWARCRDAKELASAAHFNSSVAPEDDPHWRTLGAIFESVLAGPEAFSMWSQFAPARVIGSESARMGLLDRLGDAAQSTLNALDPPRYEAITIAAIDAGRGLDALAETLISTHASAFQGKTLFRLLAALLVTPRGRQAVAAIACDRNADDAARIAALEVAATQDDLADQVLGARFGNLLDTDAVRTRRAELRKVRDDAERRRKAK